MQSGPKTINILLYDGTLDGIINISDSTWIGEIYSAPRDSIDALLTRVDCKKYGVYLLLSDNTVYVGQTVDLARRTKEHLIDKEWWTQVVLMTTKDDSFTATDIDYLESRLIELAGSAATFDSDNKNKGNPPKINEFSKPGLELYLDEALFLLELIGVRVFKKEKRKKNKSVGKPIPPVNLQTELNEKTHKKKIPPLPDSTMKIGEFVYTALENLGDSGYTFTDAEIDEMCSVEWAKKNFHTIRPFMKRYIKGKTDNKGTDGYIRFKSKPFTFGDKCVLISKEWFEKQRNLFIAWYTSLT